MITVSLLLLQNYKTTETRKMMVESTTSLLSEINDLQMEITSLQKNINQNIDQLQQKNRLIQQDISILNRSLEQKEASLESQITGLTGELKEVQTQSEEQVASLEESIDKLKVGYEDFSGIIEEAVKAVVSVQTDIGSGSGFIIRAREGYIITNYHVIEEASLGNVYTHDGTRYKVKILGYNKRADLALLQINATGLNRLYLADSDNVKVGEKAIAIGNPAGLDFTVTQGIISATGREDRKGNQYIQIDVPINPGNSGGPLIDATGKVIGVNTLKISGYEGVGFALSSNYVDNIIDDIIEGFD